MNRYRLLLIQLLGAFAAAVLLGVGTILASSSAAAGVLVGLAVALLAGGAAAADYPRRMRTAREAKERREFRAEATKKLGQVHRTTGSTAESVATAGTAVEDFRRHVACTERTLAEILEENRRVHGAVLELGGKFGGVPAASGAAESRPAGDGEASESTAKPSPKKPAPLPSATSLERRNREIAPIGKEEKLRWIPSRQSDAVYVPPAGATSSYRTSRLPYTHEVPVAIIADDFTYESFKFEFNAHRLTPTNWREVMDRTNPRVFFCESAWQGGPPSEHPWQGKIYASVRFQHENRAVLLEILQYCKDRGIPTVFWNKEDPIHFSDRINDFIRTAALFDYVFTTAEECVPMYIRDVGVKWAGVLPFAAQPRIFNPIGAYEQADTVNFAGTWYHRYPHRTAAATRILDRVIDSGRDLVIYDRMYSSPSPAYAYPEKYRRFTRPAIPYLETADAYKKSRFGVTLNTITDSKTMFARRVFELAASGSVVLSNSAEGVKNFFGDSVLYADGTENPLVGLGDEDIARMQRGAMSIAFSHTYRHRAETVFEAVGIRYNTCVGAAQLVGLVKDLGDVEKIDAFRDEHRGEFDSTLYVIDVDADPTVAFAVGRQLRPGTAMVARKEIINAEYRDRNLFTARTVIFHDPREGGLDAADLRLLRGFGNALDQPALIARSAAARYRFGRVENLNGVVAQAHRAQELLRNTDSIPVFGL